MQLLHLLVHNATAAQAQQRQRQQVDSEHAHTLPHDMEYVPPTAKDAAGHTRVLYPSTVTLCTNAHAHAGESA